MKKVFDYIANGGTEADKMAASMEYLEGVLAGVLVERDSLVAALSWIGNHDPALVSQAKEKFNIQD